MPPSRGPSSHQPPRLPGIKASDLQIPPALHAVLGPFAYQVLQRRRAAAAVPAAPGRPSSAGVSREGGVSVPLLSRKDAASGGPVFVEDVLALLYPGMYEKCFVPRCHDGWMKHPDAQGSALWADPLLLFHAAAQGEGGSAHSGGGAPPSDDASAASDAEGAAEGSENRRSRLTVTQQEAALYFIYSRLEVAKRELSKAGGFPARVGPGDEGRGAGDAVKATVQALEAWVEGLLRGECSRGGPLVRHGRGLAKERHREAVCHAPMRSLMHRLCLLHCLPAWRHADAGAAF